MTPTATVLLSLVAWTLVLLLSLGGFRSYLVMSAGRTVNSFGASGDDLDGIGKRLTRAHANCYEYLPAVGIVLLYAIATGQTAATDGLAYAFLGARMAQSIVHLISTSHTFVLVRFGFFLIQTAIIIFWLIKLFHHI